MKTRRWFSLLAASGLVTVVLLAVAAWLYRDFSERSVVVTADLVVEIPAGSNMQRVTEILKHSGVKGHPLAWRLVARVNALDRQLKAGEFELRSGMSPLQVLALLRSGKVKTYQFRILEGWTIRQIISTLETAPALLPGRAQEIEVLLAKISIGRLSAEGMFYPETYRYVKGDTRTSILLRAHKKLQSELQLAWAQRQTDGALETDYDALILASLIEKETAVDTERGQVSGVFHRRLRKGMRLQTDPTIIYGLGEAFDGDIKRRHLKQDGPYNTYTRRGLPPTPIAAVRRESLMAAVQPEPGDALYFVANGLGGHVFSSSLEAHNKAVRIYLSRSKSP